MGGSKQDSIKPATAKSAFSGVRNSSVDLSGFGKSTTAVSGTGKNQSVDTTFTPDNQVAGILQGAKQGIQNNQSIFNLTPEQQYAQVEQNPYYQLQKKQNQSFLTQGQADARQNAAQSGLENSTIAGAIEASLLKDAALQDWQARTGAIDYTRGQAAQNMGIQSGLMDQIYNYTQGPTQLANQTLMSALDGQDAVNMLNAQQQQRANMMNYQIAQQNRQRGIGAALGNAAGWVGGPVMGSLIGGSFGQGDNAMKGSGAMLNTASMIASMMGGVPGGGGFTKR